MSNGNHPLDICLCGAERRDHQEQGGDLKHPFGLALSSAVPHIEANPDRDLVLDEIERRYEHTLEDGEHDPFREALNDAYNAGLAAASASEAAPEPADAGEIIAYLRRAIQAGIFGIPAEAVPGLQAQLSALAELGRLDQHYADIVRAAMAFDEGGDYGALTAACARLRLTKQSDPPASQKPPCTSCGCPYAKHDHLAPHYKPNGPGMVGLCCCYRYTEGGHG